MSGYKSCGNCALSDDGKCTVVPRLAYVECRKHFRWWQPINCPLCGGTMSEIRTDGTKRWRHCYSCHMDFPTDKDGNARRLQDDNQSD